MPIEQVRCENCGSGDVRQLAPDSYVCEHCHTNFRWVDPTKKTVVHKQSVCKCGNVAKAFCVRCQEPVCEGHRLSHAWGQDGDDLYTDRALALLGEYGTGYCPGAGSRQDMRRFVESFGTGPFARFFSPEWVASC